MFHLENLAWGVRVRVYDAVAPCLPADVDQQFDDERSDDPEHPYSDSQGLVSWWLSYGAETPEDALVVLRCAFDFLGKAGRNVEETHPRAPD